MLRRSLMAGTGGGFAGPVVRTITSAPAGGWSQPQDPQAIYHAGKTYLGWVDGTSGDVTVAAWTHATQVLSTPFVLHAALGGAEGNPDLHDAPAILVRASDEHLVVAYSAHDDTTMRLRIGSNANDPTAFAAEQSLDASLGGTDYTYAVLVQLTAQAGSPIYLFYRDFQGGNTAVMCYSTSTDGGATWAAQTELWKVAGKTSYWQIFSDGLSRIDFAVSDGNASETASAYHFYMSGGSLFKTDGTPIVAATPLGPSSVTLIHGSADGALGILDLAYTPAGRPDVVVQIATSGSQNSIRDVRWNGTAWQINEIAQSDGVKFGVFSPGAAIDGTSANSVFVCRKVGSFWELYQYQTSNDGVTWVGAAMTSASAADNILPISPWYAAHGMTAIWLYGSYTTYLVYNLGIKAWG